MMEACTTQAAGNINERFLMQAYGLIVLGLLMMVVWIYLVTSNKKRGANFFTFIVLMGCLSLAFCLVSWSRFQKANEERRRKITEVQRAIVNEILTGKEIQVRSGNPIPDVFSMMARDAGFPEEDVRRLADPTRYTIRFNNETRLPATY